MGTDGGGITESYQIFTAKATESDASIGNSGLIFEKNGEWLIDFGFKENKISGYNDGLVYMFNVKNTKKMAELYAEEKKSEDVGPYGCFLTTACVYHKGLPDDCYELELLRNLRESFMKPNPDYNALITEYKVIAPLMLINIYRAENKAEILDFICK
ncbi:hypothetical protein [Sphingobacterium sp. LRF_L2]|uniref:hypothetical protein n=1 Tax=Sphingobacterium sp. LRF_L2 TaxID=3369421 RepID=UPI003F5F8ED7